MADEVNPNAPTAQGTEPKPADPPADASMASKTETPVPEPAKQSE